mmetsp:Transcript_25742/g.66588  ORF Transcript_25742/g.66588 Transcript_25742/m.66588 type:complete len:370 (-) Transcript_25742:43-1152(-)
MMRAQLVKVNGWPHLCDCVTRASPRGGCSRWTPSCECAPLQAPQDPPRSLGGQSSLPMTQPSRVLFYSAGRATAHWCTRPRAASRALACVRSWAMQLMPTAWRSSCASRPPARLQTSGTRGCASRMAPWCLTAHCRFAHERTLGRNRRETRQAQALAQTLARCRGHLASRRGQSRPRHRQAHVGRLDMLSARVAEGHGRRRGGRAWRGRAGDPVARAVACVDLFTGLDVARRDDERAVVVHDAHKLGVERGVVLIVVDVAREHVGVWARVDERVEAEAAHDVLALRYAHAQDLPQREHAAGVLTDGLAARKAARRKQAQACARDERLAHVETTVVRGVHVEGGIALCLGVHQRTWQLGHAQVRPVPLMR